ncbi:chemotaxis protein [Serpentinicella sp. ANB-PHB4]|uniref:chemotaxis protein n=1 Tax=Serpentinicella sp. ANB-PHB4 TaxID=3074076 RepID=UPI00285FDC12|nr:chemotaxis protein [Serpentinicella sp. ANB-PHB4]MDR5658572.1 chemotaxis protein [Serpentinicella sp. ANB-PHB4]
MTNNQGILLESGTNELEIVEFKIGDNYFGINVAKVREIIPYTPVTQIPNAHPCVKGIFKIRDSVITAVNLPSYLNINTNHEKDSFFIIAHFNKMSVGFEVHQVVGIHRISWEHIEKPDATIYGGHEGIATGIVKYDDRLILILDFEKILTDISPRTGIQKDAIKNLGPRDRSDRPILIAEDSELLMKMVKESLVEAGYENIVVTANGREAWDLLQKYKNNKSVPLKDQVACVITDIEMPQMDGHHLTKKIKEDEELSKLPVIIFSSLINEAMKLKGESLGANAQITKPEIADLVGVVDRLILK